MIWFYIICGFITFTIINLFIIIYCCVIAFNRQLETNFNNINIHTNFNINTHIININGLSSGIINKIKILEQNPDEDCGICLNRDETDWLILPCKHYFHYVCLNIWLENKKNCPICRKDIEVTESA
jgi:hypothetical protein